MDTRSVSVWMFALWPFAVESGREDRITDLGIEPRSIYRAGRDSRPSPFRVLSFRFIQLPIWPQQGRPRRVGILPGRGRDEGEGGRVSFRDEMSHWYSARAVAIETLFTDAQETGERDSTGAIMVDWFATLPRLSSVSARFDGECERNAPMESHSGGFFRANELFVRMSISYSAKAVGPTSNRSRQL